MVDPTIDSARALVAAGDTKGAHRLLERYIQRRPFSLAAWRELLPIGPLGRWSTSHELYGPTFAAWEPIVASQKDPPSYLLMWIEVFAAQRSDQPSACRDRIAAARSQVASAEDAVLLALAALVDHSLDLAVTIAADAGRFAEPMPDFAHVATAFAQLGQHRIDDGVAALLCIQDEVLRRDAMSMAVLNAHNEHDLTRCHRLTVALRPHAHDFPTQLCLAQFGSLNASFSVGATQSAISDAGDYLGQVYRQNYAHGTPMVPMPHHPVPSRPLRVGMLSDSLFSNIGLVGFDQLDPAEVVFFGYCQRLHPGNHQVESLGFLSGFRGFHGLDWSVAAAMIAADELDVLLFFGNFGVPERLEVLLHRLAARVIAFANTFGSTGGIGIDALLFAEQLVDPSDHDMVAQPILTSRFPLKIFNSHDGHLIEPVPLPQDPFRVGIIASEYKLNGRWLGALAEVLRAVPKATVHIELCTALDGARKSLRRVFAEANFPADRLQISFVDRRTPLRERLQQFSVVFDSSPFTGNLTALQALSAGVPVVTLRGETIPSRHTAGLLEAIGETSLITHSRDEQIARTIELLTRPDELAALRQRLPARVRASPMVDPKALAEELLRVIRAAVALPGATGA